MKDFHVEIGELCILPKGYGHFIGLDGGHAKVRERLTGDIVDIDPKVLRPLYATLRSYLYFNGYELPAGIREQCEAYLESRVDVSRMPMAGELEALLPLPGCTEGHRKNLWRLVRHAEYRQRYTGISFLKKKEKFQCF